MSVLDGERIARRAAVWVVGRRKVLGISEVKKISTTFSSYSCSASNTRPDIQPEEKNKNKKEVEADKMFKK
jgi:hypothetical protein